MKNQITLSNGQAVTITAKLKVSGITAFGDNMPRNSFNIAVKTDSGKITFTFYDSGANYEAGIIEIPSDKLPYAFYCFVSDALSGLMDFEEFCSEFGFDTDSRKAFKTWKACKKAAEKYERLGLGDIYEVANELQEME